MTREVRVEAETIGLARDKKTDRVYVIATNRDGVLYTIGLSRKLASEVGESLISAANAFPSDG